MQYNSFLKQAKQLIQAKAAELNFPELETELQHKLKQEEKLIEEIAEETNLSEYYYGNELYEPLSRVVAFGLYSGLDSTLNGNRPLKEIDEEEILYNHPELLQLMDSKPLEGCLIQLADQIVDAYSKAFEKCRNEAKWDEQEDQQSIELFLEIAKLAMQYYKKASQENIALSIRGHEITPQQLAERKYQELEHNHWMKHFPVQNQVVKGLCLELALEQGRVQNYEITYRVIPDIMELTENQYKDFKKWQENSPIRKEIIKELEELKKL